MDTYQAVTDRIIAALEAGTVPWQKPWASAGLPANLHTGKTYRGVNVLLLSLGQSYASRWWVTYRQAQERGGQVRKGEKASLVTFWKVWQPGQEAGAEAAASGGHVEEGEQPKNRRAPLLRYYHVFNTEQCEGLAVPAEPCAERVHQPLAACEALVAGMPQPPRIVPDGRQAYYSPGLDVVGMPQPEQFRSGEEYYGTLFHELTHSTGHPSRLSRLALDAAPAPFGSPDYSREELVAEFGAAFLCAQAGIFPRTAENSAAYIAGWLKALKGDKRCLPIAAAQAQRAADWIAGTSHPGADAEEEGAA